jgi:hypothetical protein
VKFEEGRGLQLRIFGRGHPVFLVTEASESQFLLKYFRNDLTKGREPLTCVIRYAIWASVTIFLFCSHIIFLRFRSF